MGTKMIDLPQGCRTQGEKCVLPPPQELSVEVIARPPNLCKDSVQIRQGKEAPITCCLEKDRTCHGDPIPFVRVCEGRKWYHVPQVTGS